MKLLLLAGVVALATLLTGCETVAVVDHHPVHRSYAYHGGYYDSPGYYDDRPRYYGSRSVYYDSRPRHRNVYASNTSYRNSYRTNISRTKVNVYRNKSVGNNPVRRHIKHKKRHRDRD